MVCAYGGVVDAKVEADGDIHLALQDADGKNAGTVSAEIPVGPKWCEIRQMVFGWTKQKFPFTVKSVHDLNCRANSHRYGQSLLRHCPRASGSFKPTTFAERLRCVGNSSGDETGSDPMKQWEIIADNLSKAGFSWGCVSAVDLEGQTVWIVDAHRDGNRFIVRADEKLAAFVELERAIHEFAVDLVS